MPARPPVPFTVKVVIDWQVGDKVAANVLHYGYLPAGPVPTGFLASIGTAMDVALSTYEDLWTPDTSVESITLTDLTSDTSPSLVGGGTHTGTRTGGTLPANAAALGNYSITRRYRGGHPRQYWPWGSATDIATPQTWSSDFITAADAAFTNIVNSPIGVAYDGFTVAQQVSVSYVTAGAPRTVPYLDGLTPLSIALEIASQRRRDGRH